MTSWFLVIQSLGDSMAFIAIFGLFYAVFCHLRAIWLYFLHIWPIYRLFEIFWLGLDVVSTSGILLANNSSISMTLMAIFKPFLQFFWVFFWLFLHFWPCIIVIPSFWRNKSEILSYVFVELSIVIYQHFILWHVYISIKFTRYMYICIPRNPQHCH